MWRNRLAIAGEAGANGRYKTFFEGTFHNRVSLVSTKEGWFLGVLRCGLLTSYSILFV